MVDFNLLNIFIAYFAGALTNIVAVILMYKNNNLRFEVLTATLTDVKNTLSDIEKKAMEEIWKRLREAESKHGILEANFTACQKACEIKMKTKRRKLK